MMYKIYNKINKKARVLCKINTKKSKSLDKDSEYDYTGLMIKMFNCKTKIQFSKERST